MTEHPNNAPKPDGPKLIWALLITLITLLSCVFIIKQGIDSGIFQF